MSDLRFTVDEWTGVGHGVREETATRALFRIEAGGICLTRHDSTWSRSVSERIHVSLYPAALWLAVNWWRLCYEAAGSTNADYDWRAAHELAAAGRGYLWPSLIVVPDGESVLLRSQPTRAASGQPIRYLADAEAAVPLAVFQRACDEFIATVIERLREEKMTTTDLERVWREVQSERSDPATSRVRRFEAMMHCDPDEAPVAGLAALDELVDRAGLDATNELAGALQRDDATRLLERLKAAAANGHSVRGRWHPGADAGLLARSRAIAQDTSLLPWQRGQLAARAVRAAWQLGWQSVDSIALEKRLDLPTNTLDARAGGAATPLTIAVQDGLELRWLLRSPRQRARRFEAARLLGDLLGSPPGDMWHPATELHTARQKFQRAFAAEFLCPVEGLRNLLGDDRSEDAIIAAAEHFEVSELTVEHQAQNHLDRSA